MTRLCSIAAGMGCLAIWTSAAQGQVRRTRQRAAPACNGQTISRIDVQTLPPFEPGGSGLVHQAARLATELHATTRASVVRRYLTFHAGDRCSDFERQESERILRAQPFIADARITVVPDDTGGVAVNVVTVDEVSLVVGGAGSTRAPVLRGLRLGEENLGGDAFSLIGAWQHSDQFRDMLRGKFEDFQFLGEPYRLRLQGARDPVGGSWEAQLGHPFLTDLQRFSWRASAGGFRGYRNFLRGADSTASIALDRSYADVGGVRAFGPPRRVVLLGGTLSREYERVGTRPVFLRGDSIVKDSSLAPLDRYGMHQSTRINALVGFRDLRFVRVTGFDAVEGAQDIRTGGQVSMLVGRGIKLADGDSRDYLVSADVYAGVGSPVSFLGAEVTGESRRDLDVHRWDGVLGSGRLAAYLKPTPRQTAIADIEFSGGWDQRIPFQLTLRDREGGIPGYSRLDVGGARRLVARMEDRYRFGHVRQFAALAGAAFIDAGKLWAGDAPYGVTAPVKFSAGIGLLGAVPPRSRRLWRVDLAFPLNDRQSGRVEVRFSNRDLTQWFWHEPGDIAFARERSIPNSVYNW